ncbi:MAG: hypothetical protein AB7O64_14155 [Methylibium sp.]
MISFIDHVTHQVAKAELVVADAARTVTAKRQAASELQARLDVAQAQIAEVRKIAAQRELTESESARLNISLLDQQDLLGMIAAAGHDARIAESLLDSTQRKLNAMLADLQMVSAQARRDAFLVQVRAHEAALIESLTGAWLAAKSADPMTRFTQVWQPSDELRRAAVHHQPPNGDLA